jgi:transcriptional regulator with XRE-family HTH domain
MGEQDAGEPADALDVSGAIRALRRRVDVSQRELAASSGVPVATVGRIESGYSRDPRLRTVERLVRATGARLAIVDLDGTEPIALATDRWRDRADRRFPPHLDPSPESRWRRGAAEDVISFFRRRWRRDEARRDEAGERRWELFTEIRRLGAADAGVLETLRAEAAEFGFPGGPPPAGPPLTGPQALRYLRDPSLRHWVAEIGPPWFPQPRVSGHLAARLQLSYDGPPVMVVTGFGVRPEHRSGAVGRLLAAALGEEAVRCEVREIVALVGDPAQARYLRGLGFAGGPERPVLLRLPD